MRIKLDLGNPVVTHQRILLHGSSNAGKTFLAGSAMAHYISEGKKVKFIDTLGEEGTRSIAGMGLEDGIAETISTYDDFTEILKEVSKDGVDLLCLDSLKFMWRFIKDKKIGKGKEPVISKSSTDWQDCYGLFDSMLADLIAATKDLIVLCPSDISRDAVNDTMMVSPDLPGRKIPDTVGIFDLVGYSQASPIGSKMRRVVHFEPMAGTITKARSRVAFTKGLVVADGTDAWKQLQEEIDTHV